MKKLQDLIETIIAHPRLYLGCPSIERLHTFIDGYLLANREAEDYCLLGFTEFVSAKYHIQTSHRWSEIILFFSPDGEQQAFDQFVSLFNEFKKTHGGKQIFHSHELTLLLHQQSCDVDTTYVVNRFYGEHKESLDIFLQECNFVHYIFRSAYYDQLRKCFIAKIESPGMDRLYSVIFEGVSKFQCRSDYTLGDNESIAAFTRLKDMPTTSECTDQNNLSFSFRLFSGNKIDIVSTSIGISKGDKGTI